MMLPSLLSRSERIISDARSESTIHLPGTSWYHRSNRYAAAIQSHGSACQSLCKAPPFVCCFIRFLLIQVSSYLNYTAFGRKAQGIQGKKAS